MALIEKILNQRASGGGGAVDSVNTQTGVVLLDLDDIGDGTTNKGFTDTLKTKLDNIEALADVTDSTNVDAAGAVMNSDTSTASMGFIIKETFVDTFDVEETTTRTYTVTGAAIGDTAVINTNKNAFYGVVANVTATDTITAKFVNSQGFGTISFTSANIHITIIKQ